VISSIADPFRLEGLDPRGRRRNLPPYDASVVPKPA
jgi:hypothetical protein